MKCRYVDGKYMYFMTVNRDMEMKSGGGGGGA
jgi:hypothetical protein